MRLNGTVKFFNSTKGFGFIAPDEGGKDVFVHATAVEAAGIRALNEGDRVSFELADDKRGRGKQAARLERLQ
jgi:CspA family cold shock protein